MNEIRLFSYWEHFKAAKDLALVLGPDHPKVKAIAAEANNIMNQIKAHT